MQVFLTKDFVMNMMLWVANFDGRVPQVRRACVLICLATYDNCERFDALQPAILKPVPLWTGKYVITFFGQLLSLTRLWHRQIFSMIMPDVNMNATMADHPKKEDQVSALVPHFAHTIDLNRKRLQYTFMSPRDTRVLVEQGELLMGILCKKVCAIFDSFLQ